MFTPGRQRRVPDGKLRPAPSAAGTTPHVQVSTAMPHSRLYVSAKTLNLNDVNSRSCNTQSGSPSLVMRFASVWPFKNGSVRSQVYNLLSKNYDKHRQDDALLSLTTTLYYEGANMDCQSNSGETPLMLAVKHSCMKTVRFLISKRVRTRAQNTSGWTALNFAMSNFNASRTSKSSASELAEALRLLMPLGDYGDQAKVSNIPL